VGKESGEELGRYLAKNGQVLLPMAEWIEQSKMAVDELSEVLGRAQIEGCCAFWREAWPSAASGEERWGHRLA
jgi:hypothetical protein